MSIALAFASAFPHHWIGRLADAEAIFPQILAGEPRRARALPVLGGGLEVWPGMKRNAGFTDVRGISDSSSRRSAKSAVNADFRQTRLGVMATPVGRPEIAVEDEIGRCGECRR